MQRRAIYIFNNKMRDECLNVNDIVMLRPWHEDGFAPYEVNAVIGKKCIKELSKYSLLRRGDIYD
jgi:sialic acid synthase SpsE